MAKEAKPSLLRSVLRWSTLATSALILGALALLGARPEALLFHPTPHVGATPDAIAWPFEALRITTEDGEELAAWFLPAEAQNQAESTVARPDAVILYCHGNGGNIGGRVGALAGLRPLGLSVLIFDYRGYGESSGRATVDGTRLDIAAAWNYLIDERGYSPEQIVIWGRSLGGAIAIDRAAAVSEQGTAPGALVIESSFTSTLDIGAELYPWLPVRWLGAKLEYPSRALLTKVRAPVLIAHSPDDDLIPASHGDALREAAQLDAERRVDFVTLHGGHNDGHLSEPQHSEAVADFLRSALGPQLDPGRAGGAEAQPSSR